MATQNWAYSTYAAIVQATIQFSLELPVMVRNLRYMLCLNYAKFKAMPILQKHLIGARLKFVSSNLLKFNLWGKLDFINENILNF